jgi:DNA-binding IclR family transcriptional regulator
VPVITEDGKCIGGIAISAPEARMTLDEARAFVPQMKVAADNLAATYFIASKT